MLFESRTFAAVDIWPQDICPHGHLPLHINKSYSHLNTGVFYYKIRLVLIDGRFVLKLFSPAKMNLTELILPRVLPEYDGLKFFSFLFHVKKNILHIKILSSK